MRLRGLPFEVTEDEIYSFFDGYGPVVGSLKFKVNENGRRSG